MSDAGASTELAEAIMRAGWHDAECGGYTADLELWDELSGAGPVLELGCGTGRVALHLARRDREVTGIDSDPALIAALEMRAEAEGLAVDARAADARALGLGRRFDLVIAPMQLLQLFDEAERRDVLARACEHLESAGTLAIAIVEEEEAVAAPSDAPPLPDVREIDGWVLSSLPLGVVATDEGLRISRLRQLVGPGGELYEQEDVVCLFRLDAATLAREARAVGLQERGTRRIPATEFHVASVAVLLGSA